MNDDTAIIRYEQPTAACPNAALAQMNTPKFEQVYGEYCELKLSKIIEIISRKV